MADFTPKLLSLYIRNYAQIQQKSHGLVGLGVRFQERHFADTWFNPQPGIIFSLNSYSIIHHYFVFCFFWQIQQIQTITKTGYLLLLCDRQGIVEGVHLSEIIGHNRIIVIKKSFFSVFWKSALAQKKKDYSLYIKS